MERILKIIASPGAKGPIEHVAPTQKVDGTVEAAEKGVVSFAQPSVGNVTGYVEEKKDKALERWLDWVVRASGSEPVFLLILLGLLAWAFAGVKYGTTADWAVVVSDIQAIISYIFDSLLMRQQLNGYEKTLRVSASLRSRNITHRRMLREILGKKAAADIRVVQANLCFTRFKSELPKESLLGRISTFAAEILGHFIAVSLFWVSIIVWIGFGPSVGWSDQWQLDINSATSAFMVLMFSFLANIRERHDRHLQSCLDTLYQVDSAVEIKLRMMTGDDTPNEPFVVPAPKSSRIQRAIFYYADLVGTLTGIAILIVVMVVWLAIGPLMSFNSNWWLLIGTYAGLIGLHDGFVLRNVQMQFDNYADKAFEEVEADDKAILTDIDMPDPVSGVTPKRSISYRLSIWMGKVCSHELAVILGMVLIVGLVAGASAMKWSTTGQLLCNVPPSIIESFLMMILLTGHNIAEEKRREDIHQMYLRRLSLLCYVEGLSIDQGMA
ncbi:hypothetical protein HIM_04120 [Hirsutella minnesotensis 3608]|uniref:Low-affinity iron/zinc ion transport protein fet4 n=1 Tax=Hirsutella minnesotensis 3608 TaxID=1043627 RepID=A0A0F7ZLG8_9HYPO|nr:hypothetical protein HIM_04120 [Hirsutella minnesotensis 3608]